jgi:hypothetical protein
VLIAEGRKHDSTGALIFAGYYMRAKDWSLATMDTYTLKQIALSSCQTCKRWNQVVDKYAAQGAHVKGGRLVIGETKLVEAQHADVKSDYIIDVKFTQEPDVVVRPGAAPSTEATKPERQGSYIFVSWVAGTWKVVEEESDS